MPVTTGTCVAIGHLPSQTSPEGAEVPTTAGGKSLLQSVSIVCRG